jgi:phosphate transport system substrate-binding protein
MFLSIFLSDVCIIILSFDGMENTGRHFRSYTNGRYNKAIVNSTRNILLAVFLLCVFRLNAQKVEHTISISGTQFTYPLVERWIAEYSKVNPDLRLKLVSDPENNSKTDLKIIAHTPEKEELANNKVVVNVGRYAILPIINENNQSFSKEIKKGIKQEGLKSIFIKDDGNLNTDEGNTKIPPYTVYTKTPQSSAARVISAYLGYPADDLKGIYVSGDDIYLIRSLLEDSTGVSYNNLGLIYDLQKRVPITGIKILPVDLNNNGKLDKEEQIYDNLDQLITYVEGSNLSSIPGDHLNFITDDNQTNPDITNFLNWVKVSGQQFNHQYGFLINGAQKNISLTQK